MTRGVGEGVKVGKVRGAEVRRSENPALVPDPKPTLLLTADVDERKAIHL